MYENLQVERSGAVGVITLHRPEAHNALNGALMRELDAALAAFEKDDAIGAMVIAGGERVFAAGADIKEIQALTFSEAYLGDFITDAWDEVTRCRKPVIAAVAGMALGGG